MHPRLLALPAAVLAASALLTACGGGDSSSTKASFAKAASSTTEADKACKAMLGDGRTETKWMSSIDSSGAVAAKGQTNSYAGFDCMVGDAKGAYSSDSIEFIKGQEQWQSLVQRATEDTDTPAEIASAWNDKAGVGVLSTDVSASRNDTAAKDLQRIVAMVGK